MKMKTHVKILFGLLTLGASITKAVPSNYPLIQNITNVGFAAPEFRGIYKFQILNNGVVQNIDNKNRVTQLAVLSDSVVSKVKTAIRVVPSDLKLITQDGPRCADAPSTQIQISKENGDSMLIKSVYDCVASYSSNVTISDLTNWIEDLERVLKPDFTIFSDLSLPLLKNLNVNENAAHDSTKSIIVLKCEAEKVIADDGFQLTLELAPTFPKKYTMTVERSLFTGPKTEVYTIVNTTDLRKIGGPTTYENKEVKLTINGTTSPRPDHKKTGTFTKKINEEVSENRELLCEYQ